MARILAYPLGVCYRRNMHSIPRQLATFAAVLAVLYAGGFIAGQFIETGGHSGEDMGSPHSQPGSGDAHSGEHTTRAGAAPAVVRGLAVAEQGLRLVLETPELRRGRRSELRFSVVAGDGRPVRTFDVAHEKRMHLIVVRRDATGFQHLHPELGEDGAWTASVTLKEAGTYRVFADFTRGGKPLTLASDLRVDGDARLEPLPAPRDVAAAGGGYEVRLDAGDPAAGREGELEFTVTRDGRPVETEPYLGAGGHLVALREGDLAYLHVHPTGNGEGETGVGFAATFPTEGRYRLFLQFKHRGQVRTAAFTQPVSR